MIWQLKDGMNKAGYTDIATSVVIRTLSKKGMIKTFLDSDYNNNPVAACKLTELGESWILSNQDQLVFRINKSNKQNNIADDLPF